MHPVKVVGMDYPDISLTYNQYPCFAQKDGDKFLNGRYKPHVKLQFATLCIRVMVWCTPPALVASMQSADLCPVKGKLENETVIGFRNLNMV